MSDRMVSCVRLFAFRKDISMNNKDRKRQIAYEVLMILGSLALLTFICRLWPILLLIILGIFVAAIRLLFLSGNRVDPVEPQPLLPAQYRHRWKATCGSWRIPSLRTESQCSC